MFTIFFCNFAKHPLEMFTTLSLFSSQQFEISREEKTHSDWLIWYVKCSNLSHNIAKVEDSSTFLAMHTATFCCIAGCKNGVLHMKPFLQPATQCLLQHKL